MSLASTNKSKSPTGDKIRYTFRKSERLCSQIAIGQLIREGKILNHYPLRLHYLIGINEKEMSSSSVQLAISAPKRNFKHAVKRNLLKRRIREAYRINKVLLYKLAETKNIHVNLLLVYVSTEIFSYSEIEQKLSSLLQRLVKRIEESSIVPINTTG